VICYGILYGWTLKLLLAK